MIPENYSFTRYLRAKKSLDDRSLNRVVWDAMASSLDAAVSEHPIKVLEIGAGIGSMLGRMIEWGLFQYAEYLAIDNQVENIQYAKSYLREWGQGNGFQVVNAKNGLLVSGKNIDVQVDLAAADLFEFMDSHQSMSLDLLVAHAFLDLVPLPGSINQLFNWGKKDYLYYFSINYDGLTVLEPVIDADFDHLVLSLYHDTMNERIQDGQLYGDHQAGRHLMNYIPGEGGSILAAGSSDWVVHPVSGGYPMDEAYFLHFIIHTIDRALQDHPWLDKQRFTRWVDLRHAQVERAELVYIAHQIDYFGTSKVLEQ